MVPIASTRIRRLAPMLALAMVIAASGCREDAQSPTSPGTAAPETAPTLDMTATAALAFRQVSAGFIHTCGVTLNDRAYCWGRNGHGQLGDGTLHDRRRPFPVAGGLSFREVSVSGDGIYAHTCGVTTDDKAYCWGGNVNGQLGDGTFKDRQAPVAVVGSRRFLRVSAGVAHSCGVTLVNRGFCWGKNRNGRLGDGTVTDRPSPVAVKGGLYFRQISAGLDHTCGLSTADRVFCWGNNNLGQLGAGPGNGSLTPVAVAGGLLFRQMDAGVHYSCGANTHNLAYCWGGQSSGELGNGEASSVSYTPGAVAGDHHFRQVSASAGRTCAVAINDSAYCWAHGPLGDGTTNSSFTPVRVVGGLQFRIVSAGTAYACGVTTEDRAFCWGSNGYGVLGDGTTTDRLTPTPVAGP